VDSLLLAIDCGTQSLRVLLFDAAGHLLDRQKIAYEPELSPEAGWGEQDPELYWQSLCQACLAIKNRQPLLFGRIAGLAVTALRNSLVNVDDQGNPLRPAILWTDQRKAARREKLDFLTRFSHALVGMSEAVAISQMEGKVNWIRQNQPELWDNTYKLLMVSGYLNYRLTGKFADSLASQIGYIPFDYKRRRWASPRDFKSAIFRVEREKLVELVEPGSPLGNVNTEAAQATGLAPGLPVFAAGSDKGCETLGTGCVETDSASLSFGTTATVQTTSRHYREPLRFMPAYPAPVPGCYNLEVQIFRGFWMVNWFKKQFGDKEIALAQEQGRTAEEMLNSLLSQAPPGAMGLILLPHWAPGLKTPEAKGAIIGFGDIHERAHVYRSVIEGLTFALLEGLGKIESCSRTRVARLMVSGGGSQSDEICQIAADIFNRPVYRGETPEASGLGAAIVTAVGLGLYRDSKQAVAAMVRYSDKFLPDPSRAHLYSQLYSRVYLKLFKKLQPLFREIRDIINFPEKVE